MRVSGWLAGWLEECILTSGTEHGCISICNLLQQTRGGGQAPAAIVHSGRRRRRNQEELRSKRDKRSKKKRRTPEIARVFPKHAREGGVLGGPGPTGEKPATRTTGVTRRQRWQRSRSSHHSCCSLTRGGPAGESVNSIQWLCAPCVPTESDAEPVARNLPFLCWA